MYWGGETLEVGVNDKAEELLISVLFELQGFSFFWHDDEWCVIEIRSGTKELMFDEC